MTAFFVNRKLSLRGQALIKFIALSRRRMVLSLPNNSSVTSIDGDLPCPVTASLNGCPTLPNPTSSVLTVFSTT